MNLLLRDGTQHNCFPRIFRNFQSSILKKLLETFAGVHSFRLFLGPLEYSLSSFQKEIVTRLRSSSSDDEPDILEYKPIE